MIPRRIRTKGGIFAAVLLLAFMALLSFGAALRESASFDEIAHIGAGLSYVQKFDLRLNPEHPPLTKALSGLALTLRGTYADYTGPAWRYSKDFLPAFAGQWSFGQSVIARWNNSVTTLIWARFPMLLTTGRILSQYNVGAQTRRTDNVVWHQEDRLDGDPDPRSRPRLIFLRWQEHGQQRRQRLACAKRLGLAGKIDHLPERHLRVIPAHRS